MRPLLVVLTAALLSVGAAACGGPSKGTGSASQVSSDAAATGASRAPTVSTTTSTQDYAKADRDKDNDVEAPDDDKQNNSTLNYGHAANAADKRAVTAVVKRYYAVAAAGDGAKACSMLASGLAEAAEEDYGHGSAGPAYLKTGTTCPAIMVLLFKHSQNQLAADAATLKVTRVRLVGHRGFAILSFGRMPERQIPVAREGGTWKIETLLDSELP